MLMPSTYNRLYGDIGNLNKLLAWCHATAAADLLEEADADLIISDQFTRATYVADELKKKGIETPFTQRTRAEDDPAVGAASVFARAAFLRGIRKLSRQASIKLPLGASAPVIPAGKRLVKRHGEDALEEYAKTHFKTTKKILG
jgi:ribonuclease HIII